MSVNFLEEDQENQIRDSINAAAFVPFQAQAALPQGQSVTPHGAEDFPKVCEFVKGKIISRNTRDWLANIEENAELAHEQYQRDQRNPNKWGKPSSLRDQKIQRIVSFAINT